MARYLFYTKPLPEHSAGSLLLTQVLRNENECQCFVEIRGRQTCPLVRVSAQEVGEYRDLAWNNARVPILNPVITWKIKQLRKLQNKMQI